MITLVGSVFEKYCAQCKQNNGHNENDIDPPFRTGNLRRMLVPLIVNSRRWRLTKFATMQIFRQVFRKSESGIPSTNQ